MRLNFRAGSIVLLALLFIPVRLPAGEQLAWPAPPDVPRIRYLLSLPSAKTGDRRGKTFLSRSINYLLGVGSPGEKLPPPALLQPTGLWMVGATLYVADPGTKQVVACFPDTGVCTPVRFRPDPEFKSPVGVTVSADGRMFVSDSALGRVFMYGVTRKLIRELDPERKFLVRPTGLAIDEGRNRLYVADTGAHKIHVFNLEGKFLSSMGRRGGGKGEFNFPTYISVERRTGRLLVCDSANFRVQVFGVDGAFVAMFGEGGDRPGYMGRPRGISADSDGNIYLVDGALEAVQIFDVKGQLLLYFGRSGSEHGQFSLPGGIFIDDQDQVYVADTQNKRIEVYKYLTTKR